MKYNFREMCDPRVLGWQQYGDGAVENPGLLRIWQWGSERLDFIKWQWRQKVIKDMSVDSCEAMSDSSVLEDSELWKTQGSLGVWQWVGVRQWETKDR